MKTVKYLVGSRPDLPALGYGDHWEILVDGKYIAGGHGSTCPNPYRVVNDGKSTQPWTMLYGWIANGVYKIKCVQHAKYGKCLLINGGGRVTSRVPNPRHGGERWLSEAFVHCGATNSKNKNWRASMGCCTVHPDEWEYFIGNFDLGDTGELVIEELICKNLPANS